MKKVILLVFLAFVSTVSFAQVTPIIKGGVAMSGYMGDNSDGSKAKIAGRAGFGFEYAVNEMFSIQPTLYWSDKGSKSDSNDNATLNAMYLELPVNAQFRFDMGNNMNLIVAGGPYLAYGIGGKDKYDDGTIEVKADTFGDNGLKKWDMGLNIEAGLEFSQFLVGIYSEVGFLNVAKGGPKNYTVGLNLGYRF
jgi:hypothetical protein